MTMTIPIENSMQISILVTSAISIFLATASVVLRFVAKIIGSRLDYSDYCILAGMLFNTGLHTCCMLLVTHGGFGFHTLDIYARFGAPTALFFFKGILSFAQLWNATVCFSKLSVLLMYTALIPTPSMLKWARAIGLLIVLWNIANMFVLFLICRPLAKNWNFMIPGTCGSQPQLYFAMGLINLITDAVIILLPMPYLYQLRLATRKKLICMALLSIGIGTWVITIYRQTLLPTLDFADMTYSGALATLLSALEPSVAIALACIPLMRPLFGGRNTAKKTGTGYEYGSSKQSGSGLYSKGRSASRGPGTFTELVDDNDDSSEVQLQPMKPVQTVAVSAVEQDRRQSVPQSTQAITVERKWEIRRN